MSKCTRSLSLILILILSFSLFSVNAFAVEDTENLIDSNLSNWVDCGENLSSFQSVDISSTGSNNIISVSSNSKGIVILYDLTEFLKVGESYEFTFTLPNTNNTGLGSYSLKWYLANSVEGPVASESKELVVVNSSNKSDFLGKTTTYEFTYTEGYKNTCLALYIWGNDGLTEFPSTNFYINDVSLTRVTTESEKKLDGILGWLQDIWDKLVSIGDGLTDVWTNITSSVSALGDRISSFFSDLGNKITTEFTNLTSDFSGYISSLGDRFSGFITSLGDRISGFFENLSINISGFFTDLLDGIKEFFKGFGNLILYFNWEGEYTNPFESSNSIIGGGSTDDGEDEEVEDKYHSFSLENSSWSSYYTNGCSVTSSLDTVFFRKPDYARISKFQHSGFSVSAENDIVLNFNVSSFTSTQNFVFTLKLYSNTYNSVSCEINGNGDYSLTLPSSPIDDVIYLEIISPREGNSSYGTFSDMYFNMNNATITFVPINDTGSSGNTGSSDDTSSDVSVQSALDNILEYLSTVTTDIENVMDSITGSIELFDKFCEEFPFIKALCIFVLALLIYSTVIGL